MDVQYSWVLYQNLKFVGNVEMTATSVFLALWLYAYRHTCEPNPAVQKSQSQQGE